MNRNAYDFKIDRNKPLIEEASRAASKIYSTGLGLYGSQMVPGGNNVMANNAANAFTAEDIAALTYDCGPQGEHFAQMIEARQNYAQNSETSLLRVIYQEAQVLKSQGWRPEAEPVQFKRQDRPFHM